MQYLQIGPREPFSGQGDLHARDLHAWSAVQADLLRRGRFTALDAANLAEELESMGSEVRHALESPIRYLP